MTADAHWIHVCENLCASVYVPFSQFVFIYSNIVIETFTLIYTSIYSEVYAFCLCPLLVNHVHFLTFVEIIFSSQ